MPTITNESLSTALSTQLNSIMLHHAHWFYLPLNSMSLMSNILVTTIWLASVAWESPIELLSVQALRVLAPAALCVISTTHTVRMILPINERIHELAEEASSGSDSKGKVQQEGNRQEPEIRHMQRRWGELNTLRGVILFVIAMGTMTSPAMASLLRAVA